MNYSISIVKLLDAVVCKNIISNHVYMNYEKYWVSLFLLRLLFDSKC